MSFRNGLAEPRSTLKAVALCGSQVAHAYPPPLPLALSVADHYQIRAVKAAPVVLGGRDQHHRRLWRHVHPKQRPETLPMPGHVSYPPGAVMCGGVVVAVAAALLTRSPLHTLLAVSFSGAFHSWMCGFCLLLESTTTINNIHVHKS